MDLQTQVTAYARAQRELEIIQAAEGGPKQKLFKRSDRIEAKVIGKTPEGGLKVAKDDEEYITVPRGRTAIPAGRTVTLVLENGVIHSYW